MYFYKKYSNVSFQIFIKKITLFNHQTFEVFDLVYKYIIYYIATSGFFLQSQSNFNVGFQQFKSFEIFCEDTTLSVILQKIGVKSYNFSDHLTSQKRKRQCPENFRIKISNVAHDVLRHFVGIACLPHKQKTTAYDHAYEVTDHQTRLLEFSLHEFIVYVAASIYFYTLYIIPMVFIVIIDNHLII